MSLRKRPTITEKRIAASLANGKRSRGPATAEGRERMREANTRHGFYSQAEGVALRALGEKPEDYHAVVKAVKEKFPPEDGFDELLATCLARALWGMDRGYRMQEGFAQRQARDVSLGREDRLHAHMMRLKMTADTLRLLVQSVQREHYLTTPADLEMMKNLHQEGVVKEMGEIALALFYRLEGPREKDEAGLPLDPMERARLMVAQAKEIFGIGMHPYAPPANAAPNSRPPQESAAVVQAKEIFGIGRDPLYAPPANVAPNSSLPQVCGQDAGAREQSPEETDTDEQERDERYPRITAAEWQARERPRQLLENLLTRQVELCEAQRQATLRESLKGPSPYERAAEIAPTHPHARLMRRMQDSYFREVWRLTNLLRKFKRPTGEEEAFENPREP